MSSNSDNGATEGRARRGSFTTQTFNNIFARSNSTSGGPASPFPGPITTAAAQDQRRRMSISTLGLSGTSPTQGAPFPFGRRGSVSTANSDAIDESAIDDDDIVGRSAPTTPYTRRMSFGTQALRGARGGGSPGTSGRAPSYTTAPLPSIPSGPRSTRVGSGSQTQPQSGGVTPSKTQDQTQASMQSKPRTGSDLSSTRSAEGSGFNWSEQLRTRAESSVSQTQRPSFAIPFAAKSPAQDRKSITEMPAPPAVIPPPAPARPERKKPDEFQERILKGDFYIS